MLIRRSSPLWLWLFLLVWLSICGQLASSFSYITPQETNHEKRDFSSYCHPHEATITEENRQLRASPLFLMSRRGIVSRSAAVAAAACVLKPSAAAWALESDQDEERRVYKLKSGIQLRNLRVGKGPLVTEVVTTDKNDDNDDDSPPKPTVVMHVQALLRDGTILIDTRQDGRPILYELGSSTLGSSPPGIVTPGMDDAIVSRGTLVGTAGERVEPMRQGGIRLVVVPAQLAYGNGGVSRYQAWMMGGNVLKKPVPRDEILRYEIEVLRCIDLNDKNAQACCPEELYPCQIPGGESEK